MTHSDAVLNATAEAQNGQRGGKLFKLGFFASIGIAMVGWLALLAWIVAKLIA